MENIKMYKKDLLDDIQVNTVTAGGQESSGQWDDAEEEKHWILPVHIQKLKLEIDKVMAEIRNFEFTEEKWV